MGNNINLELEKKKNVRLALGVASFGVLGFFVIYIAFFMIMFFSPWTLFSLFPFPSFSTEVTGLGKNLLIFSKGVNFKGATYEKPPEEKMTLRSYNGESISEPEEIKPFTSLYPAEDKIYFFDKGLYRTFDGKKWEEFKNPAIGGSPKGAVGAGGIWVLSRSKNKPVLNFITEKEIGEIPFPGDISTEEIKICSTQVLCLGNELHFFCENSDYLSWYRYDGKEWNQSEKFENSKDYKAIVFKDVILLLQSRGFVENPGITLRVYKDNTWSEPKTLNIRGKSIYTMLAVFKESPIIFQQGLFSERYYLLNRGKVNGPFSISKPFFFSVNLWKILFITFLSTAIYFILIFLLSLIIRRFKLKTWRIDSREYEFASFFRRFLAKCIDSLLITIPASVPLYFAFKRAIFSDNPFKLFVLVISSAAVIVLGIFLYHSLLEGLWGKTIGKKICGIIVLKDDFTKCNIWRGFLRNLMRIIDSLFYYLVAAVSMAGTMKWQRLGDIVAGTVVVRDKIR